MEESTSSSSTVTKCQYRIFGPLLDRCGTYVEVPRVDSEKLSSDRLGESYSLIRAWVQATLDPQLIRFHGSDARVPTRSDMRVAGGRPF